MSRASARWIALALVAGALTLTRLAPADEGPARAKASETKTTEPKKADAKPADKPKTVKAEAGPLTAAVTLKGVVEAVKSDELSVRPKSWMGQLVVRKAVEHGTPVKAGDVLVEFDPEKLDLALRDARQERDLTALSIRQAELELPILEKLLPIDLAAAERSFKQAAEDFERFLKVEKPFAEEDAAFDMRMVNFFLESARDELKQLQKMYKDKDLTEETEEIVLKRQKFMVERYEFFVKTYQIMVDRTLKVELPRREVSAREGLVRKELELLRARETQPLAVSQKRLSLAKLRYEEAKGKEKLAELEADREGLTVKAPADGVAYHGRYARGQWYAPSGPQGGLLRGGMIQPGEVFLTVVAPDKLTVRADADEKELPGLEAGDDGRLTTPARPGKRWPAKVTKVAAAPLNGKYEVRFEPEAGAELVPGMSCAVRVVTAKKDKALTVPASAVFREDNDEEERYVLKPAEGKPEKKPVKVGVTVGDRVEVVDGLAEGDEILAAKP